MEETKKMSLVFALGFRLCVCVLSVCARDEEDDFFFFVIFVLYFYINIKMLFVY